jgi:uncharacterized phiE125 gp8 family phage protein
MSLFHVSGPASELIPLAEVKAYLKVETSDDDVVIAAILAAARMRVEIECRRQIGDQTWRLVCDRWPSVGEFKISVFPVRSITAARLRNPDNSTTTVELTRFNLRPGQRPTTVLVELNGIAQPTKPKDGIEIDFLVGHGPNAADLPQALNLAIKMLCAHYYDSRGIIGDPSVVLPKTIDALCADFRLPRLT